MSPFAPLAIPPFRTLWSAIVVSNFGTMMQMVGASWLMAEISSSDDMVALVQASTTLPIMLFSLASGALADNFDRRRLMLIAQLFMFSVSVLLTVLAYGGAITPWLLLTFTFLIGCGTALNNPAWQASVGDMVPRSHLPAAVTLNSVAFNFTRAVGPALGGFIVAVAGAAAAFAINAVSYIAILAALFFRGPRTERSGLPREHLGPAVSAGLRFVLMSPNIEVLLLRGFAFGVGGSAMQALLPLVARDQLAGNASAYGLLLGAFGAGAVVAGFTGHHIREMFSAERLVRINFLLMAVCAMALSFATNLWMAMPPLFIGGGCWLLTLSFFNVAIQLSTPRWVVARALASHQTAAFGGMAVGSWLWGISADAHGVSVALQLAAGALVFGAALGLYFGIPEVASRNLDPINRWQQPQVQLDIQQRSGPLAIHVEYIIRPEDEHEFLKLMHERRRIRGRNGARHWTLLRDLHDVSLWIESFNLPNWTEYVRHNQRTTHADAEVTEKLRALHAGENPPRIQRLIVRPPGTAAEDQTPASRPTPAIDH